MATSCATRVLSGHRETASSGVGQAGTVGNGFTGLAMVRVVVDTLSVVVGMVDVRDLTMVVGNLGSAA